jgi:ribonuclease III
MARTAGLAALAITDHDTLDGAKQALIEGIPPGLSFLTGVEISTSPPPGFSISGSLHILGYGIDLEDPELNLALETLQDARRNRNPQILERLRSLGIMLREEDLVRASGNGQLGRPHIAQEMVRSGYAASIGDAFDRFLGLGKPAYVDKYRISCQEAVERILAGGGVPVLAHPFLIPSLDPDGLRRLVACLVQMGLRGIEVYYPGHSPVQVEQARLLAEENHLLITGGTDFHGDITPEIKLGVGRGQMFVPFSVYEALVAALPRRGKPVFVHPAAEPLESRLGHHFADRRLLDEALNHSSYIHEHPELEMNNNERLEFLGDAVLNLVAGHLLMMRFSGVPEGELSRMRANLVNESQVARLARRLDLGEFIRLGKGEALSGGKQKRSILADAYEALIAAVYLDSGYGEAFRILKTHLSPILEDMAAPAADFDYKSRLQETAQGTYGEVPVYRLIAENGPDHDKIFTVEVCVAKRCEEGTGKSKKMAEQDAARKALEGLAPPGEPEQ